MTTNDYPMISFSDEMASPDWKRHWDFLHSEASEEEDIWDMIYQSNCKNFQITWEADGGFGEDGRRIPFEWYEIELRAKSPTIEGKGFILVKTKMPSLRSHCLDMVEYWMTSEDSGDFLQNANRMLADAEDDYHNGLKVYELIDYNEDEGSNATELVDYVGRTCDIFKQEVA